MDVQEAVQAKFDEYPARDGDQIVRMQGTCAPPHFVVGSNWQCEQKINSHQMVKKGCGDNSGMITKPVFTISGPHGSGKTTAAQYLAEHYDLKFISAGHLFRDIADDQGCSLEEFSRLAEADPSVDRLVDERTLEFARKGAVVLDGQLSAHVVADLATLRIYIYAPLETRIQRIMNREQRPYDEVARETKIREAVELTRYMDTYGYDITELEQYDLVLNTERFDAKETQRILKAAIDAVLADQK